MSESQAWKGLADTSRQIASVFLRDVGNGMLAVSHNMLALVGLVVVSGLVFTLGRVDVRQHIEQVALDWLQERRGALSSGGGEDEPYVALPDGPESAQLAKLLAADPAQLTQQQALAAHWLARRYRVAPEPIARLVREAWTVGLKARLDPTLILAIVAIESSFNPFAQSPVGAQGLMQVMTRVHTDKYEAFGGRLAAFDPVTNLRVGVQVLKECMARAGGLEGGLRYYVGAANLDDDGGYAGKVLAEQTHLQRVIAGHPVPVTAPIVAAPASAAAPDAAADAVSAPAVGEPAVSSPAADRLNGAPGAPTATPDREQVARANAG